MTQMMMGFLTLTGYGKVQSSPPLMKESAMVQILLLPSQPQWKLNTKFKQEISMISLNNTSLTVLTTILMFATQEEMILLLF
jgi:hypothetical protein